MAKPMGKASFTLAILSILFLGTWVTMGVVSVLFFPNTPQPGWTTSAVDRCISSGGTPVTRRHPALGLVEQCEKLQAGVEE